MSYTAPPFPVGLRPGANAPSAKGLQRALKAAGYLGALFIYSDMYGPLTQAGVKRFHKANPQYGAATDPAIGPHGWAELHREAYARRPASTAIGEPVANYGRTFYSGKTVNIRTRDLLQRAEKLYGRQFALAQGSYNKGVAASAGTHDGGGVVDVSVYGMTEAQRTTAVQTLRKAGFAAWLRTPAQGFSYHIHACAIGDAEMAPLAERQVQAYFNGRNGLAGNGPDTNAPRPYPAWAAKYNK